MQISLKPSPQNRYPLSGILIRGASPDVWVREAQQMGISLEAADAYAVPGTQPNTIFGCMLVPHAMEVKADAVGKNIFCQRVSAHLMIPQFSILTPEMSDEELRRLFKNNLHFFHPEIGLAELEHSIRWQELLLLPERKKRIISSPAQGVFVPGNVRSFRVKETPPEEVLKAFEEKAFPKKEKFKDRPLNIAEKAKHALLKTMFRKRAAAPGKQNEPEQTEEAGWLQKLAQAFPFVREKGWVGQLQLDFEELEKRNQKEIDKLMDLLKKNPQEALKYAIPLDYGAGRGGNEGWLMLSKIWSDFSLFGDNFRGSSGGGSIAEEGFYKLQRQYMETAQQLVRDKQYQQAAFVYLKLLKNNHLAAQTLEDGQLYPEAASVYLHHGKNKPKAAECYEKAKMTTQAIELYKELNQAEKVGDLYLSINQKQQAHHYYHKVIDEYKSNSRYVKAALIYKNKMGETAQAQSLLVRGWREEKDAYNCLSSYFSNCEDAFALRKEIDAFYALETNERNAEVFLEVIKNEHRKKEEVRERTKEIAYEIVASRVKANPSIVSELKEFNRKDTNLLKDILKFKSARKHKN